jgi:hypothetical protein
MTTTNDSERNSSNASSSSRDPSLCDTKPFAPPSPPPFPKRELPRGVEILDRFEKDYAPLDDLGVSHIIDAILKHPARITHALMSSDAKHVRVILLGMIVACITGHGLAMGSFSGGHQFWFVPLKLVSGLLISALICLPSLYILSSLSGARQSLEEMWGMLLQALALASLLMVGFTPIAWIFSQSTEAAAFMGFLHLIFWFVATFFASRLLGTAFAHLNDQHHPTLKLWSVMFMLVVLQMTTALRPLIGDYKTLQLDKKQFFAAHWLDALHGRN